VTPGEMKLLRERCEDALARHRVDSDADPNAPPLPDPRIDVSPHTVIDLLDSYDQVVQAYGVLRQKRATGGKLEVHDLAHKVNEMHRRAQQLESDLTARGGRRTAALWLLIKALEDEL